MALVNEHFLKLSGSYLFSDIAKKINTFRITHPKKEVIRLGIGDVTRPLPQVCIEAMHKAVDELTCVWNSVSPSCGEVNAAPRKQGVTL